MILSEERKKEGWIEWNAPPRHMLLGPQRPNLPKGTKVLVMWKDGFYHLSNVGTVESFAWWSLDSSLYTIGAYKVVP